MVNVKLFKFAIMRHLHEFKYRKLKTRSKLLVALKENKKGRQVYTARMMGGKMWRRRKGSWWRKPHYLSNMTTWLHVSPASVPFLLPVWWWSQSSHKHKSVNVGTFVRTSICINWLKLVELSCRLLEQALVLVQNFYKEKKNFIVL